MSFASSGSIAVRLGAASAMVASSAATAAPPAAAGAAEQVTLTLPGPAALRALAARDATIRLPGVSLGAGAPCVLELEPFSVTTAATRFVVGRKGGGDQAAGFDPKRVLLLRGSVAGEPGTHAFLAVSEWGSLGRVERGGEHYVLSAGPAAEAQAIALRVDGAAPAGGVYPGVSFCAANTGTLGWPAIPVGAPPAAPIIHQIEMAVETDYELFSHFNDLDATGAYVVSLWGAVSDVYLRDVNTRIVLAFVRLWDDPDDLFNEEDPLGEFVDYWQMNMTDVQRDAAQFCSGRTNMPYGGVAYVGALCSDFAYSVVGYLIGHFQTDVPGAFTYDPMVCAHELGHNCDSLHSHNYGIDTCDDLFGAPQRGSIMSYCSQTRSGANTNIDLRFHAIEQDVMQAFLAKQSCLAADCDGNGIDDATDIAGGAPDLNGDGIPDGCQDCNGNGTLDPQDIAGASDDDNGNGIPDECEPDCNGNGQPDDLDIALGVEDDLYGDNVPDACETDCDEDGTSDYTEILTDMSLDVDRNTELDACQDCDGDGISDFVELAGADYAWVASSTAGSPLRQFHSISGVRSAESTGGTSLSAPQDLIITANGRVLVSSSGDNRVAEYSSAGAFVANLVTPGLGSLSFPTGMVIAPDGSLLVASRNNDRVNKYDINSGAFLGTFVAAGLGGLNEPWGLAYGPNGNLFVTSIPAKVIEYDGTSGALVGTFVTTAGNGGLQDPHGLLFKPDGNLLVASTGSDQILEFDGDTGAFIGQFNHGGTATVLTLDEPWTLRMGRDGDVYASRHLVSASPPQEGEGIDIHLHHDDDDIIHLHINSTRIYIYDVDTGNFVRSYVTGHDTQLSLPTGFDFLPAAADCNFNQLPDNCDIASGSSLDLDRNGVPDECQPPCVGDIDHDGTINTVDFLALLQAWGPNPGHAADLDGDGSVGINDFLTLLTNWGPCA